MCSPSLDAARDAVWNRPSLEHLSPPPLGERRAPRYVALSKAQRRFECAATKAALERAEAGQLRAVWTHRLDVEDVQAIRAGLAASRGLGRVVVAHGVADPVAGAGAGRALADALCARGAPLSLIHI